MNKTKTKQSKVKITVLVNENTRKDWKQYSLNNDKTLTETIKNAMHEYINKHPQ